MFEHAALRLAANGNVLTENVAILTYLAVP
jgi:hypothetical protein